MNFPRGNYDNEQIDNLLSALNRACKELGIADAEMLKTYAIEQFESAG